MTNSSGDVRRPSIFKDMELSKSNDVWERVQEILQGGVKTTVETKQSEAREILVDIELRLNTIIECYTGEVQDEPSPLGDSVSLPIGDKYKEISKAQTAVTLLPDKQIRKVLNEFLEDYRNVLAQTRDPERAQIMSDLEDHFKEGFVAQESPELESQEMKKGLADVENAGEELKRYQKDALHHLRQLKTEKETALENARENLPLSLATERPAMVRFPTDTSNLTKEDALFEVKAILLRPEIMACFELEDYTLLMALLEHAIIVPMLEGENLLNTRASVKKTPSVTARATEKSPQRKAKKEIN